MRIEILEKFKSTAISILSSLGNYINQNPNITEKKVKVTLVKSVIGTKQDHRATVRGLGLRKLNSSSELEDTPAVRGMINKIQYLLKVEG